MMPKRCPKCGETNGNAVGDGYSVHSRGPVFVYPKAGNAKGTCRKCGAGFTVNLSPDRPDFPKPLTSVAAQS